MTNNELRPFTKEESQIIRDRQAIRARITGVLLVGLCVLFFAITVAKIGYWK
jgi:hypothetical protein